MFRTLRSRLLGSYALLIGGMLVFIGLFLLVVLAVSQRSRLAPQVEALVRIDRQLVLALRELPRTLAGGNRDEAQALLQEAGEELNSRFLIVSGQNLVAFDSRQELAGQTIRLAPVASALVDGGNLVDGSARLVRWQDEKEQIWIGLARSFPQRGGLRDLQLISSLPEATPLTTFRETFLRPLAQAGAAALLLAFFLAWLISRSVARPLQRISQAAEGIAAGHYEQQLQPAGPQEVRRLAGSFNRMAAQVKQSQQAQREFVANVSHDLKTPLTSIQGWSQALLDGTAATPQQLERAARAIYEDSNRMTRLVNQLLTLARLEAGGLEPTRRPVPITPLLAEVHRAFRLQADQKGVALELESLAGEEVVQGDRDQLLQLVTNLVENGLRHTPAGGRVVLRGMRVGNEVWLDVQDDGPGIPAAEQERIFERFYQVDRSRSGTGRGTGLGLAIVRQIILAHGGQIELHSETGRGSLFRVRLPLYRAQPADHLG